MLAANAGTAQTGGTAPGAGVVPLAPAAATLHSSSATHGRSCSSAASTQTWNVYIEVSGVDAVYEELQERGATIDYSLYDAPHGFREFGVQDPDGYDIAFGEPLS